LEEYDAVRLFVDRIRSSRPDFAVTERNASAVAEVCQRLDGLPLAIELAAAQTKTLSVQEIAERLGHCFQLLTSGSRTALPKHKTLQATMDWSHELLTEKEQTLFRRLSVFAGWFSLEAVEEICVGKDVEKGAILSHLTQLVKKSLVVLDRRVEETWYRLLETVRKYAWEKLSESGEEHTSRRCHRDFYLRLAEEAAPQLLDAKEGERQLQMEQEYANLRIALMWSLEHEEIEEGLRLAGALGFFWRVRSQFTEGRRWLESLLSKSKKAPASARAKALLGAGWLSLAQGDFERTREIVEESLALYRKLGDERGVAESLDCLGGVAYSQDEHATAREMFEECLAVCEKADNTGFIAAPLGNLGLLAQLKGEYETAQVFFEKQVVISRETGSRFGEAIGLSNLSDLALAQGMYPAARGFLEEGLRIHWALENKLNIAIDLVLFAGILRGEGQPELAARLLGATDAVLQSIGAVFGGLERSRYENEVSAALKELGEKAFMKAFEEGRTLTLDQAIAVALGKAFDD